MAPTITQGRMFRTEDWKGYWAYGVGAMQWRHVFDQNGLGPVRALIVQLPRVGIPEGDPHRLFVERQPDDWASPGPVKSWDGDLERPTLTPSIQTLPAEGGWHGYITAGNLVDA